MPSQAFTHETTTNASVDAVWASLDQPKTWESIGGVDRVYDPAIDDQGRLHGFSFDTVAGGRTYVGNATPYERIEREKMAWRIESSELQGITSVGLSTSDTVTTITVVIEIESVGFLSSVFFPVIAGAIGSGLPKAVEEFATALSR